MNAFRRAPVAASIALATALPAVAGGFTAEVVADGVTLYRPSDPGRERANSLVVERQDGLLVVDSQPSPAAARELLALIAERSPKPVRYLILSHSHAEAAGGASAFPEQTVVLGSVACAAALADPEYDFRAELGRAAGAGAGIEEPPRRPPTIGLRATVDIADPLQPVEVRVLPPAHSRGDVTVYLPRVGLLHVGGLLAPDRDPFAADGDVGRWIGVLNAIIVDAPRLVVAVRGPASDLRPLVALRDSFAWLRGRVENGFIDRLPPAEIATRVLAEPDLGRWFDPAGAFLPDLVERAVEEAITSRRKRGAWPEPSASAPEAGAAADRPSPGSS